MIFKITANRRIFSVLLIVLGSLIGIPLALAGPASAATGSADMCTGFITCTAAGDSNFGYSSDYTYSYWGQYSGHNCTNYVAYRFAAAGIARPSWLGMGNAVKWGSYAPGSIVSSTPAVGAVAWWGPSSAFAGDGGHVSVVEQVNADGSFVDSDDNYGGDFHWRKYTPGGTDWPTAFIHYNDAALGGNGSVPNGSFVTYQGNAYRIAGGAPLYVSYWAAVGGPHPATALTEAQFAALSAYPANGTFVSTASPNAVYVFAGGAPLYVSNWAAVGGSHATVRVDPFTLTTAADGAGPLYDHVHRHPANGTYVVTSPHGNVYRIAGGSPFYISSCAQLSGCPGQVHVDQAAISHAGGSSVWSHLLSQPAKGTVAEGLPSKKYWKFSGTCRAPTAAASSAITVTDGGLGAYKPCPA